MVWVKPIFLKKLTFFVASQKNDLSLRRVITPLPVRTARKG
jgi:hypothetical protein